MSSDSNDPFGGNVTKRPAPRTKGSDKRQTLVGHESHALLAKLPSRIGISPKQVLEAIGREEDVLVHERPQLRELADVISDKPFVVETKEGEGETEGGSVTLRLYCSPCNEDAPGDAGFMHRLYLQIRLVCADDGSSDASFSIVESRSPQSGIRWAGFCATTLIALLWVILGAEIGTQILIDRLLLFAGFLVFTVPVLVLDVVRRRSPLAQKNALMNLASRVLTPVALGSSATEQTPFRGNTSLPGQSGH